jgi:hypothetical protein
MIRYLNTDLDVISSEDLTQFAAALESHGLLTLHVGRGGDGLCYATFETSQAHDSPEQTIEAMLGVVEAFTQPERDIWSGAVKRLFNIGYECGSEPWAFNNGLGNAVLRRIAASGAALQITLYPPR